jgi:Protein of unknown function (DUF2950)
MRQHRDHRRSELTAAVLALIVAACVRDGAHAQAPGQKIFASPEAAATALVTATRSADSKAMLEVLGSDAERLVSSGDPREDASGRAEFLQRYGQMHRLVSEPDGTTTLYVGAANWPLPIPLVHSDKGWYFDTDAARREILYRRIGRNELSAIRVGEQLAASEKEYRSTHDYYARRIFSPAGTHDGLYWNARAGETKSPIGPLVAAAVAPGNEGQPGSRTPVPFRGYYYHILTSQGAHAPGGAHAYLADGKMMGFAFIAYPAEYRSSGVMTFIVGEDGVVYQKDLGKPTEALAKAMTTYDPDSSWRKAEEEPTPAEKAAAKAEGAAQPR